MKQYAQNACGTIALFHVLINKMKEYHDIIEPDSYLTKFSTSTTNKSPEERAEIFKQSKDLMQDHQEAVHQGESNIPCSVNSHFIAFIEKDGSLF